MFRYFLRITAIGGASGIQVILLALLSLLLARYLSIEDFGITRTVSAYMVLLTILGHFCLHDSVSAYVAGARSAEEKTGYVMTGSYLAILVSVIVTIIAELIIRFSGLWTGGLRDAFFWTVLSLPAVSLTIVYTTLLQAVGSYRKLTVSLVLGGVIPVLLMIPLSAQWALTGWIVGRGLAYVVLFVLAAWFVAEFLRKTTLEAKKARDLMGFARIQIFSGILSMLIQSADVIALERLKGDMKEVAVYGLAALFGKSVLFLPGAVGRVYFRDIAESTNAEARLWKAVTHLILVTSAICVAMALLLYILAPHFLRFLYGARYMESIPVLNILCVGIVFSGLWAALSVVNIAMKRPYQAVAISAAGAIVAVTMLVMLVPGFGARGAAWSMNGAYAAGSAVGFFLLWRERRIGRASHHEHQIT